MEPNHRFWFNIILNKIPKFSKLNKLSAVGKFASLYILKSGKDDLLKFENVINE